MPARTLITFRQVAEILGYTPEHCRRLCRRGEFSPVLVAGRSYLFAESEIKAWAKKHDRRP